MKVGFHRAGLNRYTGFKSSPYTEGALFYGEKLVDARAARHIAAQTGLVAEPSREASCEPGSA